ncbi:uncharacterized protein RCC_08056 [Ramularia collo-cygni]|uniref:Uncharacterized protein n=1 Tax=Ramularia collo-cygni TaxID=112498 RepID=A0A2D3VBJ9_9PEZI|nr:uncharacterized protein RCC_08056 [Ramularia collo-cygni]CZT22187.1 uncharacterized protein RCC_08056 [Ramularia collo-cygni]
MKFSLPLLLTFLLATTTATALNTTTTTISERDCRNINGCNTCNVNSNTCPPCVACCINKCGGDEPAYSKCFDRSCGGMGILNEECTC